MYFMVIQAASVLASDTDELFTSSNAGSAKARPAAPEMEIDDPNGFNPLFEGLVPKPAAEYENRLAPPGLMGTAPPSVAVVPSVPPQW
jgi:hypothetical protein